MGSLCASKRKRVFSFEPNATQFLDFSQKYIHYLLLALFNVGKDRARNKIEDDVIEKIVRFEVDMALVFSASKFAWSHALKHKLERDMDPRSPLNNPTHPPASLGLLFPCKCDEHCMLSPLPPLSRPLIHVGSKRNHRFDGSEKSKSAHRRPGKKRSRIRGDEEEIGRRLMTLRRILPGGDDMKMSELFSEVESYVVCLELQVSILRTLVDIH